MNQPPILDAPVGAITAALGSACGGGVNKQPIAGNIVAIGEEQKQVGLLVEEATHL